MREIEKKAHKAHIKDREQLMKYQTPDNMWVDWFEKGYRAAFEWVDVNDRENPIPKDAEILIKLEDGSIRRYDEDWEGEFGISAIVTHWRLMELPED